MAPFLDVINSHGKTSKPKSADVQPVGVAVCFWLVSHSQEIDCQGLNKDVHLLPFINNSPARSRKYCSSQGFSEVPSENVLVVGVGLRHAGPKLPPPWDIYSAQFSPCSILTTRQSGAAFWEGSVWSNNCSESGPKGGTRDISRCFLHTRTGLYFLFSISGCCLRS